jgi:hypothetical protein
VTVLVVVEAVVVGLLAVLVAGLLRSHAEILRSLHDLGAGHESEEATPAYTTTPPAVRDGVVGPGTGATAHDLVGTLPGGGQRSVVVTGQELPTLLAFLSTGCSTCGAFWAAFSDPMALDLPGEGTRVVIVTRGPEAESPADVERLAPRAVTTVMSTEAYENYAIPGSPYFVLVDGATSSVVGEGSGTSWTQVQSLLRAAAADSGWAVKPGAGRVARAGGRAREARADAELRAAGIDPGHDSLYPATIADVEAAVLDADPAPREP